MTSIITGDIIESRKSNTPSMWLPILKKALSKVNENPSSWEIYRGDSFQIEIENPKDIFINAVYLKACIKTIKNLDIRLALGIGKKSFEGTKVTESNGEAFLFSGETLETLKKEKLNLKIKTSDKALNRELNLYFKLALISMDNWTVNSAEIVKLSIENPKLQQKDLGSLIGINQDAVSKRLKRAYLDEILELDSLFREKIDILLQ